MTETRRRTLVKTVVWRVIGIAWTWVGAYLILRFTPAHYRTAAALSTLIVAFHHSTRMAMYYGYERLWSGIAWGCCGQDSPVTSNLSWTTKLVWTVAGITVVVLLLIVVLYLTPKVKP